MQRFMQRFVAAAAAVFVFATAPTGAFGQGPQCPGSYDPLGQPLFGDLHVHTASSIDAFVFDVQTTPSQAYDYAKGLPVGMTPIDLSRNLTRTHQLRRPLDFASVTDHAEGFGVTHACTTPGTAAYDFPECQLFRGGVPRDDLPNPGDVQMAAHARISRSTLLLLIGYVGLVPPNVPFTCQFHPEECASGSLSIWQDVQNAAALHDDPCNFTTLVGYEWTAMPGTANLHRNVIFRNDKVPAKAISYFDTEKYDARVLWRMLDEACLDPETGVPGCDVLTIPHNANQSVGLMFPDPEDAREAVDRAKWEPLVEIMQHKGSSECRFDRALGMGTDTTDELCGFEILPSPTLFPLPGPAVSAPPGAYARRSYVRNVLKDGLALEQKGFEDPDQPGEKVHQNPFKLGMIGSTDTHNGTPGNVDEPGFTGHAGNQDDDAVKRMTDGGLARYNAGGLAVVWAKENTRDAIFDAMRRRETYGTSGTRPKVRFFGGFDFGDRSTVEDLCGSTDLFQLGYDEGVPMGGDLPAPPAAGQKPQFIAWAMKDEGAFDESNELVPGTGTPLQRIQIVKGWVDETGKTHEKVLNVAPRANDGSLRANETFDANVDPGTCQATATGAAELCTVWEDEDFDPARPAFYYARVIEDPTCRWTTYDCRSLGVDPFAEDCLATALTVRPGTHLADCCAARLDPVTQERAWTSPIWYSPAAS